MTLKSKPLAALVVAIMLGGIAFSSAMGWWQTESTKEAAIFTSGEFSGQANPADIRGSYTFGDVEKNFNIPAAVLAQAFGVVSDAPAEFQVKELETLYADSGQEVGTASVRLFVAFYLGLPFDLSTAIYLPESAAAILGERSLTTEQAAYLAAHTLVGAAAEGASQPAATQEPASQPTLAAEPQAEATHAPSTGTLVKGKTTFAELLMWGLTQESIEKALGKPMPEATGKTVKDFCTENGLSFETVKPALQAEVDRVK
jgi:hypothetical protein